MFRTWLSAALPAAFPAAATALPAACADILLGEFLLWYDYAEALEEMVRCRRQDEERAKSPDQANILALKVFWCCYNAWCILQAPGTIFYKICIFISNIDR